MKWAVTFSWTDARGYPMQVPVHVTEKTREAAVERACRIVGLGYSHVRAVEKEGRI